MRLYWVHTCWIALTFVGHVVSWFVLWSHVGHERWTVMQALLLLSVPILLYLISHLAVPELEDDRDHDMREYYYRQARWIQGLLLGLAMTLVVAPGLFTLTPRVHAAQAVLLMLVMVVAVSYVAKPLG